MEVEILEITILYGVLVPGIVAGVALFLVPGRLAPLATALGYWAGYCGIQGWPHFPPAESTQWFPWIAVVFSLLSLALGSRNENVWPYWVLSALSQTGVLYLLLMPAFRYSWGIVDGIGWLSAFVSAGLFFRAGLLLKGVRFRRLASGLVFLAVTGGSALMVGIAGSVVLSQLAAVQAAILGAGLMVTFFRSEAGSEPTGLLHLVLFCGLIVSGWYFVEVPVVSALMLIIVPWLVAGISVAVPRTAPPWAHLTLTAIVSLLVVAIACYLTVIASPPLEVEF